MAKTDAYRNGTALAEDAPAEEFLRPASAPPRARPQRPIPRQEDDSDGEEVFLRSRKRVPVRKGILPAFFTKTTAGRVILGFLALVVVAIFVFVGLAAKDFLDHDPRFRIDSASSIQIDGNSQLTRADLLTVFGADIGRNLFFVPLPQRRKELEQVPWVAHATVMRILPNQLRVAIVERQPIAFARIGNKIKLVDPDGVLLDMQPAALAAKHYSFPVVTGINPDDPLSVRAPRMRIYQKFMNEIDSSGEKLSRSLSEIDISDPEDVQGLVSSGNSEILLHFGEDNFLNRWHEYQSHLAEWKQQYPHLASVDLRYDRQVVLKMADNAPGTQDAPAAPATPAATPKQPVAKARPIAHPHRKHA
ncbi:FtsQ-type POTRA domain-containing protein [Alloacidobacterium dinghuense]|uniref:Cell division protein FtsQ n=1 Tax=Alloacidobacterium dinghuense TaxID=2763107 RepID=A0A7G8BIB1_9BACT|nr:FtsQ-type POTRA domain-containing protein [Alloacidobacterium dinghuense]QNI32281.1 FtsQ-type POTRA domain-containing protein [Alloacidobacterium dinghuense]